MKQKKHMDASIQERAIKGLIALWEDIYFVQGKERVASRLKPGIQDALKEVGPLFFNLAEGFAEYNDYPLEERRDLIRKDLEQKPNQLLDTHRPSLANQPLGVRNVVTTIEREVILAKR